MTTNQSMTKHTQFFKQVICAFLAWAFFLPAFASDHSDHMAITIWGIKRGMTTSEVDAIIRAKTDTKEVSTSKYKGTNRTKNLSAKFNDERSLRVAFGTEDQKVSDIYAHYQGISYKKSLQPTELIGLPKPEFIKDNSKTLIYGWGGKRLVDGDLAPSSVSEGTLLVTHRKGQSIHISLEGLPN
jgi:hypothetical protein